LALCNYAGRGFSFSLLKTQIFLLTMVWGEIVFPVEKRHFLKNNP